jgi:chaperonin GroEL
MFKKVLNEGREAQEKFLRGIDAVDKIVGNTLGIGGRNRLIQRKYKAPMIINDGATIARHVVLDDPIEDMAAQTIIELAMQTAEQAGDGTTTATVMSCALATEGIHKQLAGNGMLGQSVNPMQLKRDIDTEKAKALAHLETMSRELTDEDIENVIATSLEDMEYGKTLGELFRQIGKDGYISVEENWATKKNIDTETVVGMRFIGKYASPYLITSANKKEAIWEDTHVLVTNQKITDFSQVDKVFQEVMKTDSKKLVIFGGYSEGEAAFGKSFIGKIANHMIGYYKLTAEQQKNVGQILLVQVPSLTTPELEDLAVFSDSKLFDKNLHMDVKTATLKDLGYVSKVSATDSDVNLIGGRGNVDERIAVLKDQAELEKDEMFKLKILRRIASLASGVGIIRVGAATETERSYIKYKLEDAVLALKAAWEEGVVRGGGLAYKELADFLGEDSVLHTMLSAPHDRIKKNLGVTDLNVPDSVLDPTKVVRIAIQNACSGAGFLITADGAIAEEKMDFMDYMQKAFRKMVPTDERDSFRDSENQDQGAGRFVD